MIRFQENNQTDGRTEKRTDRPYSIRPFQLTPGIQCSNNNNNKCNKNVMKMITMFVDEVKVN